MDCKRAQELVLPYIRKELKGKELEEFLIHIKECKECYEELEIYFTIHFALRQLDDHTHDTYDIKKLLLENIRTSEHIITRKKRLHITALLTTIIAEAVIVLALVTQIQIWAGGDIESTQVYYLKERVRTIMSVREMNAPETEIDEFNRATEDNSEGVTQ